MAKQSRFEKRRVLQQSFPTVLIDRVDKYAEKVKATTSITPKRNQVMRGLIEWALDHLEAVPEVPPMASLAKEPDTTTHQ